MKEYIIIYFTVGIIGAIAYRIITRRPMSFFDWVFTMSMYPFGALLLLVYFLENHYL